MDEKAFFEMTEEEQLEMISALHDDNEHRKIISLILNLKPEQLTDQLVGRLGVAYNNNEEYEKAIETLNKVPEEARDFRWSYRIGYAYFWLAEQSRKEPELFERYKTIAVDSFLRSLELSPDSHLSDDCIYFIKEMGEFNRVEEFIERGRFLRLKRKYAPRSPARIRYI